LQAAMQEATETAAQTQQEAARGDRVAIRREAREASGRSEAQPVTQAPTPKTGGGRGVDVLA
jgi:hypothetical protein